MSQEIRLTVEGVVLHGTLNDGPAARDLATMLPPRLTLGGFHGTERVADLPRALDLTGEPDGARASAGAIAHYVPWRNLALSYRNGDFAPGLVVLGHLDRAAVDVLAALPEPAELFISVD